MSPSPISNLRHALAMLLPKAIDRAIASYEQFATQTPPDDAKAFSAHHSACKAALTHLDYLTKLAKWVEEKSQQETLSEEESLEPLIIKARATLYDYDRSKKDQRS